MLLVIKDVKLTTSVQMTILTKLNLKLSDAIHRNKVSEFTDTSVQMSIDQAFNPNPLLIKLNHELLKLFNMSANICICLQHKFHAGTTC